MSSRGASGANSTTSRRNPLGDRLGGQRRSNRGELLRQSLLTQHQRADPTLQDTVGHRDEQLAAGEPVLLLEVPHVVDDAEQRLGASDLLDRAALAHDHRQRVPRAHHLHPHGVAVRLQDSAHQREEPGTLALVDDRGVEALEDVGDREAGEHQGADGVPGQPGDSRRLGSGAAHVADHEARLPAPDREQVVEVAAGGARLPAASYTTPTSRPGASGVDDGSRLRCSALPIALSSPWARAFSIAIAARRATDSATSRGSPRSGSPAGRPSDRCPIRRPRAISGTVSTSPQMPGLAGLRSALVQRLLRQRLGLSPRGQPGAARPAARPRATPVAGRVVPGRRRGGPRTTGRSWAPRSAR